MVEFALVAPVLLLLIGATIDIGRGVLLYSLLSGAARDTSRLATLAVNAGSNTLPPDCTALATPCSLTSVVTAAHLLDSLGATTVYADSTGSYGSLPAYGGTYTANADPKLPGTITLAAGTNPNTVYVFIYELDTTGGPNPRFACPTCSGSGAYVRTAGHQRVVVDLKLKWQPVMARFLGIPTVVTLDAQSVDRLEF
jgi:hypothetical protein